MIAKPRPKRYTGPVVLLIDELSVSAAEFMASGVKDTGCGLSDRYTYRRSRAGEPRRTVAQRRRIPVCRRKLHFAKTGKMLEGIGVPPDLEIVPSRATSGRSRSGIGSGGQVDSE